MYICYKLALTTPQGLLKVAQSENISFCVPIDDIEQVSQITWLQELCEILKATAG